MPPLQDELESPPPAPSSIECECLSPPWFVIWELPPQQNCLTGGKKSKNRKHRLKKVLKWYFGVKFKQNSKKKKNIKRGVIPELCVCGFSTRLHHCLPSGSSSSTSPTSSCNFAFLADTNLCWGMGEYRVKVAKDGCLCMMEPLCFLWRWHALLSRSWMTTWGCAHMASVFEEDVCSKFHKIKKKDLWRGKLSKNYTRVHQEVQCTEQCPQIEIDVSISQFFTVFFSMFLKPCAQKMVYLFWFWPHFSFI